jgi:5-methylcytosine-specific restriction protein B
MARKFLKRDISPVLEAAERWIQECLIEDGSAFSSEALWTASLVTEVFAAFVEHPDFGKDDFMTKLKRQMKGASPQAQQLMAEMLWALLLFPSNMKARTKRQEVREIWALSGDHLAESVPLLDDRALEGIGSGGPGFNNYRPSELEYMIALVRSLKQKDKPERRQTLADYDVFLKWIEGVPRKGSRQFRHMLRYFAFPDRVERISSNNDRRKILESFGCGSAREVGDWNDRQLDEKLMELRGRLQAEHPTAVLDFYEVPLNERWSREQIIRTGEGEVPVTVPSSEDEIDDK